jgi:hypothetical protein
MHEAFRVDERESVSEGIDDSGRLRRIGLELDHDHVAAGSRFYSKWAKLVTETVGKSIRGPTAAGLLRQSYLPSSRDLTRDFREAGATTISGGPR